MTPDVKLVVEGEDVTAVIADRLERLSVVDEEGVESDSLTVELDDRDGRIVIPEPGAKMDLSLGFKGQTLTRLGEYVLDRRSGGGYPERLVLEATAADMAGGIRSPKTRSWRDTTLGDMVWTIAGEAGLSPVVGRDIAGTAYTMVAQSAESDLHLLTRLARVLDATAKPADGRLVVMRRGSRQAANGEAIPVIEIPRHRLQRPPSWEMGPRGKYLSVTAEWTETATAVTHKVTAGQGEPNRRLRETFGSADEARRAARAALEKSERGVTTVEGECSGFRPELFAGGLVSFPDLRAGLEGAFHLTRVEHVLEGALTTSFKAERASEPPTSAGPDP